MSDYNLGEKMDTIINDSVKETKPQLIPRLTAELTDTLYRPMWVDKAGDWYCVAVEDAHVSSDKGDIWSQVMAVGSNVSTMIVSDTGRLIIGYNDGNVKVSDEARTTLTTAYTFPNGVMSNSYGHSKHNNIILISSYGSGLDEQQLIMSVDDGATWEVIAKTTPQSGIEPHFHDVAFDPFANRILISLGDIHKGVNELWYSDDFGVNWVKLDFMQEDYAFQPTSIIPTHAGVFFGSDSGPDGIAFWERPRGYTQPPITVDSIKPHYILFDEELSMRHVARRGWTTVDYGDGKPIYVFAIGNASGSIGRARILTSIDGINFSEIFLGKLRTQLINLVANADGTIAGRYIEVDENLTVTFEGMIKLKIPVAQLPQ